MSSIIGSLLPVAKSIISSVEEAECSQEQESGKSEKMNQSDGVTGILLNSLDDTSNEEKEENKTKDENKEESSNDKKKEDDIKETKKKSNKSKDTKSRMK